MTTSPVLAASLAVLCVVSLGVSATTLQSAVQTDPDDVIDVDWSLLPIGEEAAVEMKAEMRANEGDGETVESKKPGGSAEETAVERTKPGEESQGARSAGGEMEPDRTRVQRGAIPLDRDRFPWGLLWILVGAGLLVALGAIGHRYAGRFDLRSDPDDGSSDPPLWPPDARVTEVDRAWLTMVGRLDVDRPWTRTPAELAEEAVDAGMDPDAVYAVTAAFEEVRYGGASVTPTHRERARAGLRRLDVEPEGDRS